MPTATVWVALTKIYYNGGLAYNAGDIIPDANNTLYSYGTAGLATQATVQLPSGITTTGVDMATQAELDALVYRGTTAPSVTTGIWVDTTATPEVVKYHNGTAWVQLGNAAYPTMAKGLRYGPRCGFMGDSITATDGSTTTNLWGNNWPTFFAIASGGRARIVQNAGIGGNTTAQMLARMDALLAQGIDTVFILGGTNNLADGDPMASVKTNITAMVAKALTAGVRPVLGTIPPAGTAAIASPNTPSLSGVNGGTGNNTTGGTLAAATYSISITAVNGAGETTGGGVLTVPTTGSTSSIDINWSPVQGASGYNIYANDTSGWKKVGTVGGLSSGSSWQPQQTFTITAFTGTAGVPGSNTTAKAITGNDQTNIQKINRWIKRYAAMNGLDCIDFYQMLTDGATGQYITGYTRDGTHPTPKASRIMGAGAWTQLSGLWPQAAPLLTGDNSDPTNLLPNGTFLNSGAGLPTGWASSGGRNSSFTDAVGTVAAFTTAGYVGNAFTTTRAVADARLHTGPAISTGFSVGDTIAFAVAMQTTGLEANGGLCNVQLSCTGTSPLQYVAGVAIAADIGPGVLYGELVVPASTTALQPAQHILNGNGTYSAITAQWTVVNLTTGNVLTP